MARRLLSIVVVVFNPRHHGGNQPLQLLLSQLGRVEDLLVIGLISAVIVHHHLVGDQRQSEDAHPAVTRNDHLVDCAHA